MPSYYNLMNNPENSPRDVLYYHLHMSAIKTQRILEAHSDWNVEELTNLLFESEAWVRISIAANPLIPKSVVTGLLFDDIAEVRIAAVNNSQTNFETYQEAVLLDGYLNKDKRALAYNLYAVKSLEIFSTLWEAKAADALVRVLSGHLNKLAQENTGFSQIDQQLIDFVNENITTAYIDARMQYAASPWLARAEILDEMRDAPKDVVNAIARNPKAWASTHRHILDTNQNNYLIKQGVAMSSTDNALLNEIYNGTKGQKTRAVVMGNPAFKHIS